MFNSNGLEFIFLLILKKCFFKLFILESEDSDVTLKQYLKELRR